MLTQIDRLLVILSHFHNACGIICLRPSYSRNSKHCMSFFNLYSSCIIFILCHIHDKGIKKKIEGEIHIIFFKEKTIAPPPFSKLNGWSLISYSCVPLLQLVFILFFSVDPKSTFCEWVREDNKSSMSDIKLNSYSFILATHPPLN